MGIYKSADGMQSVGAVRPATGFPAWPASAIGRQVAVGTQSPVEDELYIQQSVIGSVATSYPRRVAHLSGGVWTLKSNPAAAVQDPIDSLIRLGSNLYRISCDANNSSVHKLHPGQLQRSDDDGVTWANVGPAPVNVTTFYWGVQAVTIAADGVLWLCCTVDGATGDAGFPAPAIYKSTAASDGLVWTKEYEDTVKVSSNWRLMHDISAHPIDSNIIAVMGMVGSLTRENHVTEDGGASFTRYSGGFVFSSDNRILRVMDNERFVHATGINAFYSDDLGDNWTSGGAIGTVTCAMARGPGGLVFTATTDGQERIYRSPDYGQTWTLFATDTDFPGGGYFVVGIVYRAITDTLYLISDSRASTTRVMAIDNASIAAVNPTIRDVTLNLDALFPEAGVDGKIAARGLALP